MKQLKLCKNYQLLVLKYPQLQLWRNLSKKTVKKSPEKDMKLNLPNAGAFQLSMKNICQTEENIKKIADFEGLYKWQAENRSTSPLLFRLQDGPPYANGDIHIGHMVNKVLKDIYLRYKLISGYRVEYRPGWDCHGLPIELSALKSLGKQQKPNARSNPLEVRQLAANYARKFIDIQMASFRRMNLVCDWSHVYRTIDPSYMCSELDLFYKLYESNLIYRDYMPVYWSVSSQTALAESELEYNLEHLSEALYVAFEVVQIPQEIKRYLNANQKLFAPIWTTTPWSLPCNKAIAFGPNLKYGLLSVGEKVFLIEKELLPKLKESLPCFQSGSIVENATIDSSHLLGAKYTSRFIDATNHSHQPFLPSDHVSAKQGTGLVHIAPALGHDDFKLGLKHGLENRCVIDAQGRYTNDDPILNHFNLTNLKVLDESTTNRIKEILSDSIVHQNKHKHSYPYDWRTKKPCIIRSSMQWFIDTNRLKDGSVKALAQVQVRPSSVTNTMANNLANRPYWCISRQRAWGLPIPCVYERDDDVIHRKPILNQQFIDLVKQLIKKEGNVDFWWSGKYDSEFEKVLGKPMEKLEKSSDIFDIWFDSGSAFMASHETPNNQQQQEEADLYCEGIDQFTGWFQSSLLLSIAKNHQSPYKSLLVHGFVVDESDRKMSKSIGNVIEPRQVIDGSPAKKLPAAGLDTMRFWVAHEHHKPQIQIGPGIVEKFLKRAFEVRSVVRFVTGNLNDFDADSNTISYENLLPLDKYILANLKQTIDVVKANYDDMNISKALNTLEAFILIKLSSYYIKCVKDRLYCEPKQSHKRLCAQTTLSHILTNTLIMLAPIMPHLAEEAFHYSHLSKKHKDGLFRSDLKLSADSKWSNNDIDRLFEVVNQIRQEFNEKVGSDNAALYRAEIKCDRNCLELFNKVEKNTDWLVELFGCSDLKIDFEQTEFSTIKLVNDDVESGFKYSLNVSRIDQTRRFSCVRCRRHVNEKDDELCKRCNEVMNSTYG